MVGGTPRSDDNDTLEDDETEGKERTCTTDISTSILEDLLTQAFDEIRASFSPQLGLSVARSITKPTDPISKLYLWMETFSNDVVLFDGYLQQIVGRIVNTLSTDVPHDHSRAVFCFTLLYLCSRIRGHKPFSHYFPTSIEWFTYNLHVLHQVYVIEPLVYRESVELKYGAILWMNQLCKLPFKLVDLDSSKVRFVW